MELVWNGLSGTINVRGVTWAIASKPGLDFEFEDVYYIPGSVLVFKILGGKRFNLEDAEVSQILTFLHAAKPPEETLSDAISNKLTQLAAIRYDMETAGVMNGDDFLRTDRESQRQLSGVYAGLSAGFKSELSWKNANGEFIVVTLALIKPIAQCVFSHVQDCFDFEASAAEKISRLTSVAAVKGYSLTQPVAA